MKKQLAFFFFFPFFTFSQLSYERQICQTLCSPEFLGRGYVDGGDSLAALFIADEFQKMGIHPYTDSYFQKFEFKVNTFPDTLRVVLDGKQLRPGVDFLVDPSSGGGNFARKTRTFSLKELENGSFRIAIDSCIKGQILPVFSLACTTSKDTLKLIRGIARELAKSVCPVVLLQNTKFTWSVDQEQLKFPFLYIQDSVFHESNIELSIHAKLIEHTANNVIAYLPSLEKTKQTLVFSAHYDHLGKMGSGTLFPGGNDNASGVSMLLSLAKTLQGSNPNTAYVFIAFAGEEAGLLGSHYFVEHPLFPLDKINFLLNLDIMGSGEDGITVVNGSVYEKYFHKLHKINDKNAYLKQVKIRGKAANSDHYWFSEKGVPCFFIYTMGPNRNYHDVFDTYENLSFAAFDSIKKLILDFITKTKF